MADRGHTLMSMMVIVNADDLGVSKGANLGILKAHHEGIVTSASVAVTTESYSHALEACVARSPYLGVGLHFTLSFGRPVSPSRRIPLLIDSEGFLRWRFTSLLGAMMTSRRGSLLQQIEAELEAQLQRLEADGVEADHLDSERHIHLIPPVFERVVRVARRHGIRFIRSGSEVAWTYAGWPRYWWLLLRHGGIFKSLLLSLLTYRDRRAGGSGLAASSFASYLFSGRLDLILEECLSRSPDGAVLEIMVHPGLPEESRGIRLGNRQLERYLVSEDRRRELEACIRARSFAGHVNFLSFRDLAGPHGVS